MTSPQHILYSIALILSHFSFGQQTIGTVPDSLLEYEQNAFYVQLKQGNTWGTEAVLNAFDARLTPFPEIEQLFEMGKIDLIEQEFKALARRNEAIGRVYRVHVNSPDLVDSVLNLLSADSRFNFTEKIPVYRTFLTPNDPAFGDPQKRWHLDQIQAAQAWDITTGCANVSIAIIDDAVLTTHEDLAQKIYTNAGEIPSNGMDDDLNGYIDDVHGFDVADGDGNANPPSTATNAFFSHGTHVAGIAAGQSNNSAGVASIGFNSTILPVKTKSDGENTVGLLTNPMQGVEYAIVMGADVLNISWGSYAHSQAHQLVFNDAYSSGQVTVAAAGNDGVDFIMYPAAYDNVISVAASDQSNDIASFSNFSFQVTVFAPGVSIWSSWADGNSSYGYYSGTSMATPIVSGVAALMLCHDPSFTPEGIQNCIANSANSYPSAILQGVNIDVVNAEAAVNCAVPFANNCSTNGCELIANGGFEEPSNSSITTYGNFGWAAVALDQVCGWSSYLGTSDVFPNPVAQFDNYAGLYASGPNNVNDPPFREGLVSEELALISGREYVLELDAAMAAYSLPIVLDSLYIGLMSNTFSYDIGINPPDVFPTLQIGAIPNLPVDTLLTVFDQPDVLNGNINFVPFFHHYTVHFTMPAVTGMDRIVFLPYNASGSGLVNHIFLDNISLRASLNITATADQDTILEGDCVNLTASGSGNSYVWEPSAYFSSPVGANQQSCPDTNATFIATTFDSVTGCTASDTVSVFVIPNPNLGVSDLDPSLVAIYPNPFVDYLILENQKGSVSLEFDLYDCVGSLIQHGSISPNASTQIRLKELSTGIYLIRINNGQSITLMKQE